MIEYPNGSNREEVVRGTGDQPASGRSAAATGVGARTERSSAPSRQPEESPAAAVRQSILAITQEMEKVIDAAEHAASELRAEAETEAAQYIEERRREADEIHAVGQATARGLGDIRAALVGIEGHLRELISAVETAVDRTQTVTATVARGAVAPPSAPAERPREFGEAPPEPSGASPEPSGNTEVSRDAALIRATQLVIGGRPPAEIEAVLREEFGRDDAEAIVAQILGPG